MEWETKVYRTSSVKPGYCLEESEYDWEKMCFDPDAEHIYEAFAWARTPEGYYYWNDNRNTKEGRERFERMKRLYREQHETGPVRTVTRKEIVPGVYGKVAVHSNGAVEIEILSAEDDLTDAIQTLTAIRDAMQANTAA